ncbi:MAG: hypothetical protein U0M50_09575 [Paramuribaculum sp.]
MERIYAHRIIYRGNAYDNHVIELSDDGRVRLFPFTGEIHSTRFIPGTVEVSAGGDPPHLQAKAQKSGN